MKLLDYFMYMCYRLLFYVFKRDKDNAKWSSLLYLGLYSTLLLYSSLHLYLYKNTDLVPRYWSLLFILMLGGLFCGVYSLRYYMIRKKIIEELDDEYINLSPYSQLIIKWIFGLVAILIPIIVLILGYITKHI